MSEREFAIEVVRRLREAGHQALWAGGCVRDELMGLTPKDYDVATDARPEEVQKLFRRTIAVGVSFGVVEVLGPRSADGPLKVQVATFRADVSYSDGRHPDAVVYASAREDALRRDFTINGMFFDPLAGAVIDFVGGRQDLEARVLRAIGDPVARFHEDKLRLLRGVRIASRFDLAIESATAAAMQVMADQIGVVSAERIAEELRQLLTHRKRARGMNLLDEMRLLQPLLPELLPLKDVPDESAGNLWDHVLRVLDLLGEEASFPLAMAGLLHEIGKPPASDICQRLKLSNTESERIEWLVEKHLFLHDARRLRPSQLKMTLAHEGIRELLALHRADALAAGQGIEHVEYCEHLLETWTEQDLNPPSLLTGHDLIQRGLEPGPIFKRLLDAVREAQLDGIIKTPQEALELVNQRVTSGE